MRSSARHYICMATLCAIMGGAAMAQAQTRFVSATDPSVVPSDYVAIRKDLPVGVLGFERILDIPQKGYRWDNPGARARFRTNSAQVSVKLVYTGKHLAPARNSVGVFRVDGKGDPAWIFQRPSGASFKEDCEIVVSMPVPGDGGFHTYEIILPYGDSVDIAGLEVDQTARFESPEPRPSTRYVAFGDSITHGFTASNILNSYVFRVAGKKGWQLINVGFGGRGARDLDGDFIASLKPDILSILIGVNSWQGGVDPETFRLNMTGLLQRVRKNSPLLRIYLITPLWVPPSWQPKDAKWPLETYRQILRDIAKSIDDKVVIVEGPTLIDPDATLFDKVAVHPNDAGFAQMSERLAEKMILP